MLDWITMALADQAKNSAGEAVKQNKSLEGRVASLENKVDKILEIVKKMVPQGKK